MTEEMNLEQVQNILKFIEATQTETVKADIFRQFGRECFHTRKNDGWLEQYRGNVQAFLDRVNIQQAATYWEKLEFSEDGKTLFLTGRIAEKCACAYADCPLPPKSLCNSCCKGFQQEFFHTLLGQPVEVEITEAYLLGGERCSTAIHLV